MEMNNDDWLWWDPAPEMLWQLWYQDNFDRECPRSINNSGQGLTAGLTMLWKRHLGETIQKNGLMGFSRFNLWFPTQSQSISIKEDKEGSLRLKKWLETGKKGRLQKIAAAHACIFLAGHSGAAIPDLAKEAEDYETFEAQLLALGQKMFSSLTG